MFIRLEVKSETPKAYQLPNGSWIPKSVLDDRGLKHPYYQIKGWWLRIQVENVRHDMKYLQDIRKNFKEVDKNNSIKVLQGIQPMVITIRDLPKEILNYWGKYWKGLSGEVGCDMSHADSTDRRREIGEWEMGIYD